jgi:two-component system OmpR family response regulator
MNAHVAPPIQHVLVVEDDKGLREEISLCLEQYGYGVHAVGDGGGMEDVLAAVPIDVVVLDIMLPDEDGLAICKRLVGRSDAAIIIVSARGEEVDRIVGLELGADDYLAKPCSPRELLARIRAVLRRRAMSLGEPVSTQAPTYSFQGYRFDLTRCQLRAPNGAIVSLTRGEAVVLGVMLDNARQVVSRGALIEQARGEDADIYDRTIDVQISRLRRKLHGGGGRELIRTIRGAGYIFDAPVSRP